MLRQVAMQSCEESDFMEPQADVETRIVKGAVRWFSVDKGFGFVGPADGSQDIFLHFSVLDAIGKRRAYEGDLVECEVGPGKRGEQVIRILDLQPNPDGSQRSSSYRPQSTGPTEEMMGEVKWFNPIKGFGFVQPDDGGRDVFLHMEILRRLGLSRIDPGARLKMQVSSSDRGREARDAVLA
jgi:CspA family cold shock protein